MASSIFGRGSGSHSRSTGISIATTHGSHVVFATGAAVGAAACALTYEYLGKSPVSTVSTKAPPHTLMLQRAENKLRKLQNASTERVLWRATEKVMLGLMPRLWMEVLDKNHRCASLLCEYWYRWQLSDTKDNFFTWLDEGLGSMVDLPQAPRRLLDEWRVIYLNSRQRELFHVRIQPETGRFLWAIDGSPVTVPAPIIPDECMPLSVTPREREIRAMIEPALQKTRRRDLLLAHARAEAELARSRGEEATMQRLREIAAPLIKEGLLCQLRDPYFNERLDAATTPNGHGHLHEFGALPTDVLPSKGWDDILAALAHDQLMLMKGSQNRGWDKGIFIIDTFGRLHCGTKMRGIFQHSSFVEGHCVQVAGGIKIVDGWLVELSPHSGHYQPSQEQIENMINDWRSKSVDIDGVTLRGFMKE
eukprot:TRINITY_DN76290_c0_g1_i1.p1 TRINITY_DN76290_c0_g1~~TRINITY_DN76290_c0_g1_i1.p1  ORF type:complete len:460 (+),score=48.78 TRINITY_DN76290_c0_g1_i1:122-1381(+)